MTRGFLLLLISELAFSIAYVFAKFVTTQSAIPGIEITIFRFGIGFIASSIVIIKNKTPLVPNKVSFVALRAVFNTAAVICLFIGLQYTTITKANMLNMTYPAFVFLLSPFINGERASLHNLVYLVIAITGIHYVIMPESSFFSLSGINMGDIISFASGIFAGFAITTLREARKHDESALILFYLMGLGTITNIIILIPYFVMPDLKMLVYMVLCGGLSVLGQFTITEGYRYIEAARGSLVSTARIFFSMILGVIIFQDIMTFRIAAGCVLIIISLVGVSGVFKLKRKAYAQ